MNDELRWYAQRAGAKGASKTMRKTGWSLVDDSDAGFGGGALVKGGFGGLQMVLKNRHSGLLFTLNALYGEIGLGFGAEVKGGKALDIATGLSTDGGVMPGGSRGEFMFGHYAKKGRVDTPDWCNAIMVYVHCGGTMGAVSGDTGYMFLLDLVSSPYEAWQLLSAIRDGEIGVAFLQHILCWQICRGVGFALGLDAGAAVRVMLTGELTLTQESALASANWRPGGTDDPAVPRYPGQY